MAAQSGHQVERESMKHSTCGKGQGPATSSRVAKSPVTVPLLSKASGKVTAAESDKTNCSHSGSNGCERPKIKRHRIVLCDWYGSSSDDSEQETSTRQERSSATLQSRPRQRSRSRGAAKRPRQESPSTPRICDAVDVTPTSHGNRKALESFTPSDLEKGSVTCEGSGIAGDTPRKPLLQQRNFSSASTEALKELVHQTETGVRRKNIRVPRSSRSKRKLETVADKDSRRCTSCWRHGVPRAQHADCPFKSCCCWMCKPESQYPRLLREHGVTSLCAVSLCRPRLEAAASPSPVLLDRPPALQRTASLQEQLAHDSDLETVAEAAVRAALSALQSPSRLEGSPPDTVLTTPRSSLKSSAGQGPQQLLGPVRVRRKGSRPDPPHLAWVCVPRSIEPRRVFPRRSLSKVRLGTKGLLMVFRSKYLQDTEKRLGVFGFRDDVSSPRRVQPLRRLPRCARCRSHGEVVRLRRFRDHCCPYRTCQCSRCGPGLPVKKSRSPPTTPTSPTKAAATKVPGITSGVRPSAASAHGRPAGNQEIRSPRSVPVSSENLKTSLQEALSSVRRKSSTQRKVHRQQTTSPAASDSGSFPRLPAVCLTSADNAVGASESGTRSPEAASSSGSETASSIISSIPTRVDKAVEHDVQKGCDSPVKSGANWKRNEVITLKNTTSPFQSDKTPPNSQHTGSALAPSHVLRERSLLYRDESQERSQEVIKNVSGSPQVENIKKAGQIDLLVNRRKSEARILRTTKKAVSRKRDRLLTRQAKGSLPLSSSELLGSMNVFNVSRDHRCERLNKVVLPSEQDLSGDGDTQSTVRAGVILTSPSVINEPWHRTEPPECARNSDVIGGQPRPVTVADSASTCDVRVGRVDSPATSFSSSEESGSNELSPSALRVCEAIVGETGIVQPSIDDRIFDLAESVTAEVASTVDVPNHLDAARAVAIMRNCLMEESLLQTEVNKSRFQHTTDDIQVPVPISDVETRDELPQSSIPSVDQAAASTVSCSPEAPILSEACSVAVGATADGYEDIVASAADDVSSAVEANVASPLDGPSKSAGTRASAGVDDPSEFEANVASAAAEEPSLVHTTSTRAASRHARSPTNLKTLVKVKRKTGVLLTRPSSQKVVNHPEMSKESSDSRAEENSGGVLHANSETDVAFGVSTLPVKSEMGSARKLSGDASAAPASLPAATSPSSDFADFSIDVESNLDELKEEVQDVPGLPLVTFMCEDLLDDGSGASDDILHECAWCGEVFKTAAEVESHSVKHAEPDEDVNSGEAPEVHKEEDEDSQNPKPLFIRPKPWSELAAPRAIPQTEPAVAVPSTSVNTKLNTDSAQLRRQFLLVRVPRVVGSMVKARPAFRFVPGTAKTTREAAKPPGAQAVVSTVADQSLATTPLISTARSKSASQTATAARDPPVDVLSSPGPKAKVANDAHRESLACSIGTGFEPVNPNFFECSECAVVCVTRKDLAVHRMTRHGSETWHRCLEPDCKSTFHSLLRQRVHTAIAHKLMHFTCQHCSECLPSTLLLEAHMAVKHNRTPVTLQCPLCPTRSPYSTLCRSVAALTTHFRSQHAGHLPLTCSWCGWRTNRIADMLPHHRNHVDRLRQLHCPACVAWFPTRDVLVAHVRAEHGEGATYDCPTCKKCCKSLTGLHKHLRIKHPQELSYKCLCGEAFASPNRLREHAEATMHMAGAGGPLFNFRCTRCRYLSSDAVQIMEHHDTAHVDLLPLERMAQLLTLMRDAKVIKEERMAQLLTLIRDD